MNGARAGGTGGQEVMEMQHVGKLQGKIRERKHPRPLCMHRKMRRRGEAGNEQEEQSWRWE